MYERIFATLALRKIMIQRRCDKWEPYGKDKVKIYRKDKFIDIIQLPLNTYDKKDVGI